MRGSQCADRVLGVGWGWGQLGGGKVCMGLMSVAWRGGVHHLGHHVAGGLHGGQPRWVGTVGMDVRGCR